MKNDFSFKLLAVTVLAALVLSLVDASSSPQANPESASGSPVVLVQR